MAFGRHSSHDDADESQTDPVPYTGGYDIEAEYGAIKRAGPHYSYPRPEFSSQGFEASYDDSQTAEYSSAKPSYYGGHDASDGCEPQVFGFAGQGQSGSYANAAHKPSAEGELEEGGYSAPRPNYGSSEHRRPQKSQYSEDEPSLGYNKHHGRASYSDEKPDFEEDEAPPKSSYGFGAQYQRPEFTEDEAPPHSGYGFGTPYQKQESVQHGAPPQPGYGFVTPYQKQESVQHEAPPQPDYGFGAKYQKPGLTEDEAPPQLGYGVGGQYGAEDSAHGFGSRRGSRGSGHGTRPVYAGEYGETEVDPGHEHSRRKNEDEFEKPVHGGHHSGHHGRHGHDSEYTETEANAYGETGPYNPHGGHRAEAKRPVQTADYASTVNYGRHGGYKTQDEERPPYLEGDSFGADRPYHNQPPRRRNDDEY